MKKEDLLEEVDVQTIKDNTLVSSISDERADEILALKQKKSKEMEISQLAETIPSTWKLSPKGMDADGSTLLVVPAGTSVNNQGQIVSAPGTIGGMDTQKVMMVGGGIVAAVLLTVIIIKVLK